MNATTKRIAQFGLLTALMLVLGLADRAIPLSAILGGGIPGIRLGLANTVLLYAVYMMDWKSCLLLMITKVILSGFLFGSLNAMLYSLAGSALSLAVMLAFRRKPGRGALTAALLAGTAGAEMLIRNPHPKGQRLGMLILTGTACLAAAASYIAIRKKKISGVTGTSLAGAVAHNTGQVLVASVVLKTPLLMTFYLPVLIGAGAAVGCLTGIVTDRVLRILRVNTEQRTETEEEYDS